MQPQQNFSGSGSGSGDTSASIVCAQCGAPMPREMRFCRSCGNRLGEGSAEYTETVRFPTATAAANGRFTGAYTPGPGGPIAPQAVRGLSPRRRRLGFTGMTWMWIALGLFFAGGGAVSTLVKNVGHFPRTTVSVGTNRSYFGVDGFKTGNGGVTFDVVEPPDSPADKAGLVGGDIVTSFDGHPVKDEGEIMDLLTQTPPGKTVEVIYTRDGNFHNTQLTTVSNDEYKQLDRAYANRPEGKGVFGYDDDNADRILVPETRTYGVRLGSIEQNGPADLAGIKKGDIVIEFDKVPIRTTDEFLSRVRRTIPYSTVKVVVMREGQRVEIPVKLGKR